MHLEIGDPWIRGNENKNGLSGSVLRSAFEGIPAVVLFNTAMQRVSPTYRSEVNAYVPSTKTY